jgi:TonB-linked SusC/RagA family outer membrane protein
VNSFAGFQNVYRKLPLTNGAEYAKYYNEALVNGGQAPVFSNPEQYGKGTDWQDAIFRKALITKHELAISGGSKESVYRISGSFLKQEGIIIGSDYQRMNFTINASHKVKSWLQVGERLNYSYGVTNKIADYDGSRGILSAALEMDPTVPLKNPDGSWGFPKYSDTYNPLAQVAYEQNLSKDYQLSGNVYGQIDFTPALNVRSQFNLNLSNGRYRSYTPVYFVFPVQKNDVSSLSENAYNASKWAWENTLNYKLDFGKHHFQALLGLTQQHSLDTDISAYGENLPEDAQISPALRYLGLASSGQSIGGGASEWGMVSYFGRINYDYADKYLATVNVRRDGSSKFGRNNRFGTFPSFSLGWRLSNEAFMKDITFLNDLKLRGGWGQLGNEGSLSTRATVSTLEVNVPYPFGMGKGQQVALGAYPQSIGNPDLKWESTKEWDFGVDASFLNNRLTFSGGYYDRLTSGILARLPILALVGVENPPYVNGGSVSNKGFEFSLGLRNPARSDFEYDVTVHFSTNHNKVVSLANDGAVFYSGEVRGGVNVSRTAVGHPIGAFWGYVMDGIFQNQGEIDKSPKQPGAEPGDIRFKDISGDGKIDADDQQYIGSPWPTYNFGINGAFRYKNMDLNLTISGRGGNEIYAGWKYWTNGSSFYNYFAPDKYDTWHGEGTSNSQPRNTVLDPNNNLRSSTRWIQSGAYIRLNNLQLGYSLPQSLLRSIHITRLRFYIAAENLLTITKYDGYNPEVGMKDGNDGDPLDIGIDRAYYPQARSFSAGLNLSF